MNQTISHLSDLSLLLSSLIVQLWSSARNEFFIACAVGIVLAVLVGWLTYYVALNFNRRYFSKPQRYVFCGTAGIITLCCTLLFFAFRFTGDVAERIVTSWEKALEVDTQWSDDTFRKAYEAVYELRDAAGNRLENFTGKPHPDSGQQVMIPTTHEESKLVAARVYAEEAVKHFTVHHPLLSKILRVYAKETAQAIYKDIEQFFSSSSETGEKTYPVMEAVQLAKNVMRQSMIGQIPRVMLISRTVLVLIFLLIQGVIFSLLIRSALADIKVR
ncbi:MAG: hypothetical protein Q3M24_07995 [Candidatus Electrothrix aestuarii]|uniref:DUF4239 domain-containing protein n=1 Tax=Candidatus Electrothrix aestuarii TaxID=3062594 RepID=A0AAU8LZT8_9BACT|nr:hypothetical protein [Candidatus Electrothrix aestuarii]